MSDGQTLLSYTIITGEPNDVVKPLHDRMPVVLSTENYERWLRDPDPRDLMQPCANETVIAYPVSARVGTPKNNDAALVEPVDNAWQAAEMGRDEE